MKLGFSQMTVSPSLQRTFAARSMPCWPPVVMISSSSEAPMENFSRSRALSCSRSGPYPSVTLYCSAPVGSVRRSCSEIARIFSTGKESADGFPAAREIMFGSLSDLNISRMAEGCISFTLSENT